MLGNELKNKWNLWIDWHVERLKNGWMAKIDRGAN